MRRERGPINSYFSLAYETLIRYTAMFVFALTPRHAHVIINFDCIQWIKSSNGDVFWICDAMAARFMYVRLLHFLVYALFFYSYLTDAFATNSHILSRINNTFERMRDRIFHVQNKLLLALFGASSIPSAHTLRYNSTLILVYFVHVIIICSLMLFFFLFVRGNRSNAQILLRCCAENCLSRNRFCLQWNKHVFSCLSNRTTTTTALLLELSSHGRSFVDGVRVFNVFFFSSFYCEVNTSAVAVCIYLYRMLCECGSGRVAAI